MYPGIWQILLVVVLLVLLFGRGKISELMGDVAKGIKSFKKGMSDDPEKAETVSAIEHETAKAADAASESAREKT